MLIMLMKKCHRVQPVKSTKCRICSGNERKEDFHKGEKLKDVKGGISICAVFCAAKLDAVSLIK